MKTSWDLYNSLKMSSREQTWLVWTDRWKHTKRRGNERRPNCKKKGAIYDKNKTRETNRSQTVQILSVGNKSMIDFYFILFFLKVLESVLQAWDDFSVTVYLVFLSFVCWCCGRSCRPELCDLLMSMHIYIPSFFSFGPTVKQDWNSDM